MVPGDGRKPFSKSLFNTPTLCDPLAVYLIEASGSVSSRVSPCLDRHPLPSSFPSSLQIDSPRLTLLEVCHLSPMFPQSDNVETF